MNAVVPFLFGVLCGIGGLLALAWNADALGLNRQEEYLRRLRGTLREHAEAMQEHGRQLDALRQVIMNLANGAKR